ncbi:MAG: glycoside hydrolase family 88 protein [Verrucomicrobiota bacterium]
MRFAFLLRAFVLIALAVTGSRSEAGEPAHRLGRTPRQVATALAARYGQAMPEVGYIPALALTGRLAVAAWTSDAAAVADVERIAAAARTPEARPLSGPALAGHLVYTRLGQARRVTEVLQMAFDAAGQPVAFLPNHGRMSDSVFMDCPLLAAAARLTGDRRYLEACRNHFDFMRRLCLRADGLYRHSPPNEAAWGRGNGFPALGVALVLRELATGAPEVETYRKALRAHLDALLPFQDEAGMWHQVIDHRGSYPEFSATCMISFALHQGLRERWLEPERYQAPADRAWEAIKGRIGMDGERVEGVCTSTGAQKTLEDYLKREAIFGRDERGGAMALLLAVEREAWEQARSR